MSNTLVMLLAGGEGSRLNILVEARAKPAVPFGGIYRIIDFTLSNIMNSGLERVGVLTQYKPLSLMSHIGTGKAWDFEGRNRGIKILPPHTGEKDSDWYKGTADALRQNMEYLTRYDPEEILIVSGDHIYYMDYAPMIAFHKRNRADLTVAMMKVPKEQLVHFGTAQVNGQGRIKDWEEKPKEPKGSLASLGIYVFQTPYLLKALQGPAAVDFGRDLIPSVIKKDRVFAYPFSGYWRDVGTLAFYYETHLDLLNPRSGLNPEAWGVQTNLEEEGLRGDRPAILLQKKARVARSFLSADTVIEGRVEGSVLSPGVRVARGAQVFNSILMHDCQVEAGAHLDRVIVDKKVRIGKQASIIGRADSPNREFPGQLKEGLTLIGKGASIPSKIKIQGNTIIYPSVSGEDFPGSVMNQGETVRKK
ncbi:MAG: glucose-1-phosphate adenylyltransferase [Deltaproteobacteria bacterium]|nr:glucose-1-phosphate adenylyltransferase [Deltaproteobacteria bacterium]